MPSLATSLRAYGTDGEQAISIATAEAFSFATHLRCANHLKDNIVTHLHKQLLPQCFIKEILMTYLVHLMKRPHSCIGLRV